jgi:hypothetical protein
MNPVAIVLAAAVLAVSPDPGPPAQGAGPERPKPERPKPERSRLQAPVEIEGVPCAPGYVWHYPGGRLHRCTLDRDASVRGATLPKGAAVAFEPDGSHAYVFLPRTTEIEGYSCRGSGHNFMTVFHPDGRLKLCWMPENREVQGIPCAGFSIWADVFSGNPSGVYLHPNGRLSDCRLSTDVTVDGRRFARGSRLFLDEEGHPTAPRPR